MEGPLAGIRVVDLAGQVAGASGTQLLGDMGAEIIKIEAPSGERVGRTGTAGPSFNGDGFIFLAFNRNKKSVCLDLWTPAGKGVFYDLVRVSDVVYDNFRPGVMEHLGADYQMLHKINPRIICFSSSGYGSSGPYRDRPGYDMMAQAETGIAGVTGFAGQEPLKCGPAIVDITAGIFGALAVTAALQARATTGQGQRVETSLMSVGAYLMTYHLVYYLISGQVPPRLGNGHIATVPNGIYRTKDDRYVAICAAWPRIARTLSEEWLIEDPRFKDSQARAAHRQELDEILGRAFRRLDAQDWLDIFKAEDIQIGLVNSIDEVADHPQLKAQEMFVRLAHQLGGEFGAVNSPVHFDTGLPPAEYSAPPLLGQHTSEVLARLLGYSQEKIAQVRKQQEENAAELAKHTIKQV